MGFTGAPGERIYERDPVTHPNEYFELVETIETVCYTALCGAELPGWAEEGASWRTMPDPLCRHCADRLFAVVNYYGIRDRLPR